MSERTKFSFRKEGGFITCKGFAMVHEKIVEILKKAGFAISSKKIEDGKGNKITDLGAKFYKQKISEEKDLNDYIYEYLLNKGCLNEFSQAYNIAFPKKKNRSYKDKFRIRSKIYELRKDYFFPKKNEPQIYKSEDIVFTYQLFLILEPTLRDVKDLEEKGYWYESLPENNNGINQRQNAVETYITFDAMYFSNSRQSIRDFEIKFPIISIKYIDVEKKAKGKVEILSLGSNGDIINYQGSFRIERNKMIIEALNLDAKDISINVSAIIDDRNLEKLSFFQGILTGYSTFERGDLFSYEFLAGKKEFWEKDSNYNRAISSIILRRNNFRLRRFRLGELGGLERKFSISKGIADDFKDVIQKIKKFGMIILNYGIGGDTFLSKVEITDDFRVYLKSYLSKKEDKLSIQICHLSARDKENKILVTIYFEERLTSIVSIDFNDYKKAVLKGTFTYLGGKDLYTDYLVAIIAEENLNQNSRILNQKEKKDLKEKNGIYEEAFDSLQSLSNNADYTERGSVI